MHGCACDSRQCRWRCTAGSEHGPNKRPTSVQKEIKYTDHNHTIAYLPPEGGGSLSTLVKPVSHSQKKKTSHSLPPLGGRITPNFGHFPYKKKAQKIFPAYSAPGFCVPHRPGGGSMAQNQSLTFKKPVSDPSGGGGTRRARQWFDHNTKKNENNQNLAEAPLGAVKLARRASPC